MQLGDSVPVQLMHKDKTGSLEEVSARSTWLKYCHYGVKHYPTNQSKRVNNGHWTFGAMTKYAAAVQPRSI